MRTGAKWKAPAPGNLQAALQGGPPTGFPQWQVGTKQARPDRTGTNTSRGRDASSHQPAGLPAGEA